jgi:hypothetical protein
MYDWVTTTTVDGTGEFGSIQYILVYETYVAQDDIVYNEKDN